MLKPRAEIDSLKDYLLSLRLCVPLKENGVRIADDCAQLCASQTAFHMPLQKTAGKLALSTKGWD